MKTYSYNLLSFLQKLYEKNFKEKIPKTMNKISTDLLTIFPNCIFFKIIQIKSYSEKADKNLDKCFPGNIYPEENDVLKKDIYTFLENNSKNFQDNSIIVNGINNIIEKLKNNSFIKKYINLIDIIASKMNNENRLICKILVTNPFKYKELVYFIDSNFSVSPLPNNAEDFYALSKYSINQQSLQKFKNNTDSFDKFREEILGKISELNGKISEQSAIISELNGKITQQNAIISEQDKKITEQDKKTAFLKKDIYEMKEILFNIQLRDIIKGFNEYLSWSLKAGDEENIVIRIKNAIQNIINKETEGGKMIIDLIDKIEKYKKLGNEKGHYFKNIGFTISQLPDEIKNKYEIYKKKENCGITSCDCIALLLSVKEINDSSHETTKNKYNLLDNIINISAKGWETNKKKIAQLLISYKN